MKEIIELVKEVFDKRIPKIEILQSGKKNQHSLYYKLYEGIKSGVIKNDTDASTLFYNSTPANINFRLLKMRFKERLLTTILFVEPRERSSKSYSQQTYFCYKNLVVAKLLITIGAQRPAHKITKSLLTKSNNLELFDVIQQCALILRRNYLLSGDIDKFNYYNLLFLQANEKILAENRAEELYYQIIINFSNSLSPKPNLASLAKLYIDEISILREKYNSFLLNYYVFNLEIVYNQLINDFKNAIEICDNYQNYLLKANIFYTKTRHANMLVVKLDCCLQIRDYSEGKLCAEQALSFYSEGVDNWFILLELYFLLSLNTENIEKAVEIFLKATENERFKNIQPQRQEIWRIYGGYLSFFLHYKEEHYELLKKLTRQKPEFKFSRLINEIPIYAKDKKGMNVAVLILHILILLQNKSYLQISKRTEALYQYTYRNLNKDDAYRSHYFIKMLIAMEKSSFNFEDTIRKTGKYLEKLRMENVQYSPTQTRMEIIPYEDLWNIILKLLQRN